MTRSTIQLESRDKVLLVTSWTEIMTIPFLKKARAILLTSSKLQPCLSKQSFLSFKKKLKELEITD